MSHASIFMEKSVQPTLDDVAKVVPNYADWKTLSQCVVDNYPKALEEWKIPAKSYGWSYRLKDKKRNILYLVPHDDRFTVGFVFGQAATDEVLAHPEIPFEWKKMLIEAKVYVEGRVLSIEVYDSEPIPAICELINIKIRN
jgi:hypothetical protein